MRHPAVVATVLLPTLTFIGFGGGNKTQITVRSVSHASQINEYSSTYNTPGTASTNCSGSATAMGNTTNGTANCQTVSTPPETHQITRRTMDVTNVVEADGMRYIVVCRAGWVGSKCAPMIDGDYFPAEIDGTTMWIEARKGGNQGKKERIKYKILDIRPAASSPQFARTADAEQPPEPKRESGIGEPLDNAAIVQMVKIGVSESTIEYVINLRPARYSLGPSDLAKLQSVGVSDSIIKAMIDKANGQ